MSHRGRGQGSPTSLDRSVYSKDWGRVRVTTRPDTGRRVEGRREPTGEAGVFEAGVSRPLARGDSGVCGGRSTKAYGDFV